MNRQNTYSLFLLAMVTIMLLFSACTQTTTGTNTSSFTPLQVLQNSAKAMRELKSSHVEMQFSNHIQTKAATNEASNGVGTPTATSTPAATGTTPPQNVTITIKGSGDQALPDQMQLNLAINALNQNTNVSQILQGEKVYVKNAEGQWYVMDKSDLQGYVGNPLSGMSLDQNSLLGLVQHTKIADHGLQPLNGQTLRHISADLDKTALRQLLNENPDLKTSLGQQNIDTMLDNTQSFKSTVDVWIDESKFYLHRTQLRLNIVADISGIGDGAPQTVSTDLNTTVDLSKFNVPVTITPPAHATPTDNPGSVFGIGKP